jgi:hypothetical protein
MTLGRDVWAAYFRMEALEQLARISTITRTLGNAARLSADEIARLEAIRGVYGSSASDEPCYNCGWPRHVTEPPAGRELPDRAHIRELVRRALREERGG